MRKFLIMVLCCAFFGFGIGNAIMSNYWKEKYDHEKEYIEEIAEMVGVSDPAALLEFLKEEFLE